MTDVSRQSDLAGSAIFRKLREAGYEVMSVNPTAPEVECVRCYPDLGSIPGGVDAVMMVAPQEAVASVVGGVELAVRRAGLHRPIGQGSVSEEALRQGRESGVQVIVGACPLMFVEPVDLGHECPRW